MPDDNMIQIAVIIVRYHSNSVIQSCINSLDLAVAALPSNARSNVELILVANSSDDDTFNVTSRECNVTNIRAPSNLGFSPAVNLGLAAAPHADFILLLNPDAQLAENCLATLLSEARSRRASLVGPILCDPSGQPHGVSERPFHSVHREFATQILDAGRRRPAYGQRAYKTGDARCLTGACLLIEGSFIRAVGGLDTEVHMYLEDVMLCWQAQSKGDGVVLACDAFCYHALGGSAEGANFASSLGLHLTLLGARVRFVRRTSGAFHAWAMRALMAIGAMIRAITAGPSGRRKHLAVLRWALTSGTPPPWRDGPVVDSV
jgi:GT2 family glycosyltransferase